MLNVKKLSELLAQNVDAALYPKMFIMSPNGTLLAYSKPVDIKELRDQAALVSMAWKDHQTSSTRADRDAMYRDSEQTPTGEKALETLTIELETNNLIVRALQQNLLLVLVGGATPRNPSTFRMTAEVSGDERYPSRAGMADTLDQSNLQRPLPSSPPASHMSQREKDLKVGALHIQRKKLDALTRYLRSDFDSRGFTMPDDGAFP